MNKDLLLLGYADRWSVAPGQTVRFMVSCAADRFDAQIVRVTGRGPRPDEGTDPLTWERARAAADGGYPGRRCQVVAGSYGIAEPVPAGGPGAALTAWVYPTRPSAGRRQVILAWPGITPGSALTLELDERGRLRMTVRPAAGRSWVVSTTDKLTERQWAFVGAGIDLGSGRMVLVRQLAAPEHGREQTQTAEGGCDPAAWSPGSRVCIAAAGPEPLDEGALATVVAGSYNGKIEWAAAHPWPLDTSELLACAGTPPARPLLGIARLVNAPMQRMTGHRWSGRILDWRLAPEQYQAVWFHDDDLSDARWPAAFGWTVPESTRSGMYAARMMAGDAEDVIPFYVRPGPAGRTARLAVLIPTFTYTVYSNFAHPPGPGAVPRDDADARAGAFLLDHPEFGLSPYCSHRDGSGISHVSTLRPMIDMRPWHRIATRGNAGRELSGDLYLIDWLEASRIDYDIVTDHDLHAEGAALLAPYSCVLTGGHPEYTSEQMLNGLRDYTAAGGNLAYLGGNGFYWVTAVSPDEPHVLEVRRGHSGSRTWTGGPGEDHHTWTGEPGGHWRDRGRAPQALTGVGFSAQGGGQGAGFARTRDSKDPAVAFIFAGIGDDEVIGDFGLKLGGAAADEIDRADHALGTPPGTLLIATSAGRHDDAYQRAIEEVGEMNPREGGSRSPYVRADMTYFETPSGGSVFSAGSIAWSASLAYAGYQNNVSRVTANVIAEFTSRPAPEGRQRSASTSSSG